MNLEKAYAHGALADISYLGDVLGALESVRQRGADRRLLTGAAAIGRRIVRLADEAGDNAFLSDDASYAREAIAELRGFGEIVGALDRVPPHRQDEVTLLGAASALGRTIARMAVDAGDAPASEGDVSEAARCVDATITAARETGRLPDLRESAFFAFSKEFRKVEHGGVRLDGRFWSSPALAAMHGERVAVFIPKVGDRSRVLVADGDGAFVAVADEEPPAAAFPDMLGEIVLGSEAAQRALAEAGGPARE